MNFLQDQKVRKASVLILITFIVCLFFVNHPIQATSWSLLPPLLAIFIAFISGRLSLSLGSAVFLGSFISDYGESQSLVSASGAMLTTSFGYFKSAGMDSSNLQILGFVFFILSMVHVMTVSGGLHALVGSLQKWIVGPRSAQFVTALLGCLIFIDDYANTMIVGSTMKKVTDRYNISREKLAFIVDATSAPIAGVALVSTWIGYEVGLFSDMAKKFAWSVDGYAIFLDAIGFRFYCFMMLFFVFTNILFGVDFGPMKSQQKSPIRDSEKNSQDLRHGHLMCSIFPLGLLLGLVFSLLWIDGGGLNGHSVLSLTSWREVLTDSENGIWILFQSSLASYIAAVILALTVGKTSVQELTKALRAGIKSAWLPILILILAWSVKLICDDLKTGEYIVSQLGDRVSRHFLPMAIFVVSAITAFSTGTSWGTMAILIPTITPLAVTLAGGDYSLYVSLCLAAILDGAIMGDHCSPISDTTIMSSISTDCDLLSHVRTQLPYSLLVGFCALFFGYFPAGYSFPLIWTVTAALLLLIGLFFVLKSRPLQRRKA